MESQEIREMVNSDDSFQVEVCSSSSSNNNRGRVLSRRGKSQIISTNKSDLVTAESIDGNAPHSRGRRIRKRGKTSFYRTKKGRGKGRSSGGRNSPKTPSEGDGQCSNGSDTEGKQTDESMINSSVTSGNTTNSFRDTSQGSSFLTEECIQDQPLEGDTNKKPTLIPSLDVHSNKGLAAALHHDHSYNLSMSMSDSQQEGTSKQPAAPLIDKDDTCLSGTAAHRKELKEPLSEPHSNDLPVDSDIKLEHPVVLCTVECKESRNDDRTLDDFLEDLSRLGINPPPLAEPLINEVLETVKARLPQYWICLPEGGGVNVMLVSRADEKAIQRRIFFPYREGCKTLTVHRKPVPESVSNKVFQGALHKKVILQEETKRQFVDRIISVVDKVRSFEICMGVFEKNYKIFWDLEVLGEVDRNWYGEVRYEETYRPHNCKLLISTIPSTLKRCSSCMSKKKNFASRVQEKDVENRPHTRNTYLNREELLTKMERKQRSLENARAQIVRLKEALKVAIDENGVAVDEKDSNEFCEILEKQNLPPGQELFIHEQIKIARAAKPCGRTWHPTILGFAILLKSTSTAAYRAVADSGMFILPSERTLFEYTHAVDAKDGCTNEKLSRICKLLKEKYPKNYKRYHVLLMDEMHVNKKLVFLKSSGEMVGYVKMTEAEQELAEFEAELKGEAPPKLTIASKVLTLMINCIAGKPCEVVATFPTADTLDANGMYHMIWETIGALERSGIWIIAIVGDGASINRAFFASYPSLIEGCRVVYCTKILAAPHRPIFFYLMFHTF